MSDQNAKNGLGMTSVPFNSPSDQSVAQPGQVPSNEDGKQKGSLVRGEWLNAANKVFKIAERVLGALPVVGSYVGAVAKVGLTVVEMVQEAAGDEEGLEFKRYAGSLKNLQEQVRHALEEIQVNASFFEHTATTHFNCCQLLANLKVSILVSELHNENAQIEQHRLLDRLDDGNYGAEGNLIENITCLPGTQTEILQHIDDWIRNTSDSEQVLWIREMAGRGKLTIVSTVAHNWKRGAACAIFHFRRGQNKLDNRLICSLAQQLAKSVDPEPKHATFSSMGENEDIAKQSFDEQFNALFVTPLSDIKPDSFPVLIIVDALDECNSVDYAVDFVKLIERRLP
ncbi:hypothetical protein FS837_001887 [Tulasnella sp. UAMH 9824]|nr:hypothetical protein FS837_001887 [Tulasnella sp. UAMH 9824]